MELHGARRGEAASRGRARPAPEEALRAGRAAALRAGQVVSGRVAAALGVRLLVAARRRPAVARRSAHRRRNGRLWTWRRRSEPLHPCAGRGAGRQSRPRDPGVRRRLALPHGRAAAAGQRRSAEVGAEERRGARAPGACLRAGTRHDRRLRAAGEAPERVDRQRLDERAVVSPLGASLPHPRRFAIGYRLPLDSLPWATPADTEEILESDPFARRDPLPRRQLAVLPEARVGTAAPRVPAAQAAQVAAQPPPRGKSAPGVIRTALCVEPRQGRVHVFMPPVESTEDYIELDRRNRTDGGAAEDAGHHRRHAARARSAAQPPQGDAGPRRHRGQHASGAQLAGDRRADLHALRRGAPDPARDREVPARRPAHRHRRRQPHGARRGDAGRQPVPAPARSPAQPARLLAQSPVAVVPLLGALLRPDEPASARRRGT